MSDLESKADAERSAPCTGGDTVKRFNYIVQLARDLEDYLESDDGLKASKQTNKSAISRIKKEAKKGRADAKLVQPVGNALADLTSVVDQFTGLSQRVDTSVDKLSKQADATPASYAAAVAPSTSTATFPVNPNPIIVRPVKGTSVAPKNTYTVEISPSTASGDAETCETTRSKLLGGFNPSDFGFVPVRIRRRPKTKGISVEATTPELHKLVGNSKIRDLGLTATVANKKLPLLSLFGVPAGISAEDLVSNIISQNHLPNWDDSKSSIKAAYKFGPRNLSHECWALEVTPDVRTDRLSQKKIDIGWNRVRVQDRLRPTVCFRCCKYGHTASRSRSSTTICGYCAAPGHKRKECPNKGVPSKRQCGACVIIASFGRGSANISATNTNSQTPSVSASGSSVTLGQLPQLVQRHDHEMAGDKCSEHKRKIRDIIDDTDYEV